MLHLYQVNEDRDKVCDDYSQVDRISPLTAVLRVDGHDGGAAQQ
jgi:hypothetical protein